MPLAVTLMANLGMEGKSTAKELFDAWFESGLTYSPSSEKPEQSMNRSIRLSVESDLVKQRNSNAIFLLATRGPKDLKNDTGSVKIFKLSVPLPPKMDMSDRKW